ncbi:hypothetical protein CEUSTIGMA_g501.t1 [Chlamydomonas eustigma]|uniref:thioredoxin-dependent peroxiredoxin n=1 Tax=Chlamydomonas eustigma TaxID=1157962 RepID=A0A250WQF1_9CHLO|nr:hypothetical protein CEUSTIGMA_g501.t1 [Chlamydomonas eustigma]|eukprot:GAX73048.1 hypothetical protein CEUSTIGMA_g501.t1 [Chlamydomonas eustigma]
MIKLQPSRTSCTRHISTGFVKRFDIMAPKRKVASAAEDVVVATSKKVKADGLSVGDDFPDLGPLETEESTDASKETVDLKDILKTKGVILFFYPRANTPGCTTQACGLRDTYESIAATDYELFGMSADKPKSQLNWKTKNNFPYHLLCDPSFEALKKLGVAKGGKSVNRSHIIVEKGGKVVVVEYGITPKNSIAGVKEFIESKK